ncbi:MAG: electron transporter RnfD [Chitinophagaceae bacterium]|nr:electron transporter RnfD [Chitinophagaceae bacterium]
MRHSYKNYFFPILAVFLFTTCRVSRQATFINPADKKILSEGRVAIKQNDAAEIYWPGSGFVLKFKGSSVNALLKDERGYNYFNVEIDGKLNNVIKIDTVKKIYTLAEGLSNTVHTLEIIKRADWYRGKTWFYGFELPNGSGVLDVTGKKRMIEFYGNSITVGAAVEDNNGDNGDSIYTNNFKSYAFLTARHFNAHYSCIASSGIGLMVSWGSLIMPEIYDRLNPDDSSSKWDFSKATPGIVVINLFQNDCGLVTLSDHPQFKRRFGDKAPSEDSIINAYSNFVQNIRSRYPDANIICVLGSMDAVKPGSPWPGYIEKAVASLNDKKVFTHFFSYSNLPGHPKKQDQIQMAEELIWFIEQHIKW